MSQNNMPVAEWASQARFGGPENGDNRDPKQRGKMHRTGVVGEQHTAPPQFGDKLFERGLPNPVNTMIADRSGDLFAYRSVVLCPQQNPLHR